MKPILLLLVALLATTLAQDQNVFLPFDPFQDDPIEPQLGQLTEFDQEADAESLPQQEQEQEDEQPQQQQEQQQQEEQDDDEFDAFREDPQFEQLNAAPQDNPEPQLGQLNVNRQQTSEPQLKQVKKKEEVKKKWKSLGAVGLGGSATPVDLKHEKIVKIKAHPKFKYQYQVHDKKTKDIKEKKEERNGHKLRGEYKLLQPDHLWRHVKYSSDKKQGWIAHVTYTKG